MIGRILGGLGSGPIIAMTPKVAAEWFPPQQRAMFNGVASAAFAGGVAIGLSVVEYHYGESEKDPRHLGAGYRHHHCIL
jgi:MFS family permease